MEKFIQDWDKFYVSSTIQTYRSILPVTVDAIKEIKQFIGNPKFILAPGRKAQYKDVSFMVWEADIVIPDPDLSDLGYQLAQGTGTSRTDYKLIGNPRFEIYCQVSTNPTVPTLAYVNMASVKWPGMEKEYFSCSKFRIDGLPEYTCIKPPSDYDYDKIIKHGDVVEARLRKTVMQLVNRYKVI